MSALAIRRATGGDAAAIAALQNALLATTAIEWTDTPHTVESRVAWIRAHQDEGTVLVAEEGGEIVGFAAYGDFRDSARWPGYRFVVENTIHVRRDRWGSGVGRRLMEALIAHAAAAGKHAMVAAVTGDNPASIRFHERLGFVEVARMPEIGAKHGRWLDLVLLQRRLDDRPAPPAA